MSIKLIADSGSTKCEWCLLNNGKKKRIVTQGISPYFLDASQIEKVLREELLPHLKKVVIEEVYYYGTGRGGGDEVALRKKGCREVVTEAKICAEIGLLAAAHALCGHEKGIACILGTGSNSCYYNGRKIVKNSPGLGYVLGDEGSGAYMGKKVVQHFLYNTFDDDLRARFTAKFQTNATEILNNVYKRPQPNRYLASFAIFLAENRGHYMVENIIEDSLNDFFFNHLYKYRESWTLPISFVGSIAFGFKDVLKELCTTYELELGTVLKAPMDGLIKYHL